MKAITLSALTLLVLSSAYAQETYKAPDLRVKDVTPASSAETVSEWRSHQRVQDQPAAVRALASDNEWVDGDQKDVARDPSSIEDDGAYPQGVKPWRFYPE